MVPAPCESGFNTLSRLSRDIFQKNIQNEENSKEWLKTPKKVLG